MVTRHRTTIDLKHQFPRTITESCTLIFGKSSKGNAYSARTWLDVRSRRNFRYSKQCVNERRQLGAPVREDVGSAGRSPSYREMLSGPKLGRAGGHWDASVKRLATSFKTLRTKTMWQRRPPLIGKKYLRESVSLLREPRFPQKATHPIRRASRLCYGETPHPLCSVSHASCTRSPLHFEIIILRNPKFPFDTTRRLV